MQFLTLCFASGQFKQCTGTQLGPIPELHGFSSSDRLELYKQMYTNCTFVEYNLEIVGLDASADLSFLADIEQVCSFLFSFKEEEKNLVSFRPAHCTLSPGSQGQLLADFPAEIGMSISHNFSSAEKLAKKSVV